MLDSVPIRETVERLCPECGGKFENPLTAAKICYSCWLAEQIPDIKKYQKREGYWLAITSRDNPIRHAMFTPRTGIPFLDVSNPIIWGLLLNDAELMDWRDREQQQGLNNNEYVIKEFPLS
jgi:hypothetical protein